MKCGQIYSLNRVVRHWHQFSIRITKKNKTFHKGYTQRWTEELFRIFKIQIKIPVIYEITYYNGEEIQGSFYEQELQKTDI